jgi:hypothetical protein
MATKEMELTNGKWFDHAGHVFGNYAGRESLQNLTFVVYQGASA